MTAPQVVLDIAGASGAALALSTLQSLATRHHLDAAGRPMV